MIITKLIRKAYQRRHRKQRKQGRSIPVVRRRYLNDAGDFVTDIISHTQPGSTKLEFPYTIPTITTAVEFTPEAEKAMYITAATLGAGLIGSAYLRTKSKR